MEWKEVRLGDILNFRRGHDLPHSAMKPGNIPVAGSNGVIGYHDTATPIKPILTIGRSGNVGKPYFYEEAWAHNTTLYVDDFKGNDPKFLYYLCQTMPFANFGGGSAVPTLNRNHIHPLETKIPVKVEDQCRIASILSSLDRKIELNNKINADLEEMAQAIFKNWFVDFEPFKNGKFVDSELGMIPEGWKVGSLGDFCNVFTGKKNTNQAIEKGLYPFFSCAPEPLASNDAIFNGKAIIIAGNGSYTGRTSFYNGGFDLYQRTYACTIREQDKENLMIFFYHMMKQFFEPTKMGGTRGSSIPYIVMGDITQQKFP